jgi:hypothetical protein
MLDSNHYVAAGISLLMEQAADLASYKIGLTCILIGGLSGCVYCLRAIYLNASVRKNWDVDWHVWYYLRPIVSASCGGAGYLFLKAGLLVLDAKTQSDSNEFGFYALALVAGYNVDNFLKKLEEVSEAVLGIGKSRSAVADRPKETTLEIPNNGAKP